MARKIPLTPELADEYQRLFDTCRVRSERDAEVNRMVDRLLAQRSRYAGVAGTVGIPWYFIGVVHALECSFSFERHLHNGDPLGRRTTRVPAGRPATGTPPFTWEESAVDALADRRRGSEPWTIPGLLYRLEAYNGLGYRRFHPTILSPYLWSFSNHYTQGKYVGDNQWSATAVSKQCGAAVMLRRLHERGQLHTGAATDATPAAVAAAPLPPPAPPPHTDGPLIRYWTGGPEVAGARELQRFLNRFPGIAVVVDGKPGELTSEALRRVTGRYLAGDPREAAP